MNKKFNIIYADPPWNGLGWNNGSGKKCPANHYKVLDVEEIKKLPIESIADENCALFLWVTFPNLQSGLDVMQAWGFRYCTIAFNWVKKNKKSDSWFLGCGNYTRANSEVCLLGMKGQLQRVSKSVHSVLDDRVMSHSQKPDEAAKRIVQLFGDIPRVELFARRRMDGWDACGDQVESSIVIPEICN